MDVWEVWTLIQMLLNCVLRELLATFVVAVMGTHVQYKAVRDVMLYQDVY